MKKPGPPEQTADVVERARQTAAANFQLLVMLEAVREWIRADAQVLAEAAQQTEAATGGLERPPDIPPDAEAATRAQDLVLQVQRKLDRLMQLAPEQSRDPLVVSAVLEGLRRLRVANEGVQAVLPAPSPLSRRQRLPASAPAWLATLRAKAVHRGR